MLVLIVRSYRLQLCGRWWNTSCHLPLALIYFPYYHVISLHDFARFALSSPDFTSCIHYAGPTLSTISFFCPCNCLFVAFLWEIASNSSPLRRRVANIFVADKPPFVCNRLLPHHGLPYSDKYMYSFFTSYFCCCLVIHIMIALYCILGSSMFRRKVSSP